MIELTERQRCSNCKSYRYSTQFTRNSKTYKTCNVCSTRTKNRYNDIKNDDDNKTNTNYALKDVVHNLLTNDFEYIKQYPKLVELKIKYDEILTEMQHILLENTT